MLYFTHLSRSPQWMDYYQIWYRRSPRGRNQLCQIFCRSVQVYCFSGGLKFAYPHRNWRSPLILSELPFRLIVCNKVLCMHRLFISPCPDGLWWRMICYYFVTLFVSIITRNRSQLSSWNVQCSRSILVHVGTKFRSLPKWVKIVWSIQWGGLSFGLHGMWLTSFVLTLSCLLNILVEFTWCMMFLYCCHLANKVVYI